MLSASSTIKLLDFPPHNEGCTELGLSPCKNPIQHFLDLIAIFRTLV
jgi:hypothetical protein